MKNGMANGVHVSEKTLINQSVPLTVKATPFNSTDDDPSLAWKRDGKVYNKGNVISAMSIPNLLARN